MSQRRITVQKRITEVAGQGAHRLQMWVSSYQDIDPGVFVWQRKPAVLPESEATDEYTNVANAADLVEYPTDDPDPDLPPFFRMTYIDLLFISIDLLNRSVTTIKADLRNLILNLDLLDTQADEYETIIEGEVIESSSSSQSSSSSNSSSSSSTSSNSSSDSTSANSGGFSSSSSSSSSSNSSSSSSSVNSSSSSFSSSSSSSSSDSSQSSP